MQPTVKGVPLSSKEMCSITENDVWNQLGFSPSVSHYPLLNTDTRPVVPWALCIYIASMVRALSVITPRRASFVLGYVPDGL